MTFSFLEDILTKAKKAGADQADILLKEQKSLSYSQRLGALEKIQRAEEKEIGLRVFKGQKQALISATLSPQTCLDSLVDQAICMVNHVPSDPYSGLEPFHSDMISGEDLNLKSSEPTEEKLIEKAQACEEATLALSGIQNSGGVTAAWSSTQTYLLNTHGFQGAYEKSFHYLGVEAIAGSDGEMEAQTAYTQAIHEEDLEDPQKVGERAGTMALRHLGARKIPSTTCPVLYSPFISGSLLSHLCQALNGDMLMRGLSFFKDALGQEIFPKAITIVDDPYKDRGLRSYPFDAEGVYGKKRFLVENGILGSWILDSRSSRALNLSSTGHGSRSVRSIPCPSPSNVWIEPGSRSPQDLMNSIEEGFFVTEFMGSSVNPTTGDYSRGARGFWIEKGQTTFPVKEVTLSGNLKEMFRTMEVASDLEFRSGIDAPTVLIPSLCIAGK